MARRSVELEEANKQLVAEIEAIGNDLELTQESLAELELALEDRGWLAMSINASREFTRDGLNRAAALQRILAMSNPLVKRALALRHAYVFGQGVEIQARAPKDGTEDVGAVVQKHLDANSASLFGEQAQEELERAHGTDGNLFLAHFTNPRTGAVKVRSIPFEEIAERVCNPEDSDEPWFYLRRWTSIEISPTGAREAVRYEAFYPDLAYRPATRQKFIDDVQVMWDAPILHSSVNRLDGQDFGIGDAYAAMPWARAYSEFLNGWATLVRALSRYAWRITGNNKATAAKAGAEVRKNTPGALPTGTRAGAGAPAGATVSMAGANLEAIPKTGATIDSESGRPLAAMVAASLGIPVTMLLADPGQTGARAVAETLDKPTRLIMLVRQRVWRQIFETSMSYAVDQAIKAPAGPLRGTKIRDEWGDEVIVLAGNQDRTIEVTFPSIDDVDPKTVMETIVAADGLDVIEPAVILRAALMALPGVEDIDEIIDRATDEDGNFISPSTTAGDRAVRAFRNGEDPAGAI